MAAYDMTYDAARKEWKVVDTFYKIRVNYYAFYPHRDSHLEVYIPEHDPRHFQLGAVVTPRAVLGI